MNRVASKAVIDGISFSPAKGLSFIKETKLDEDLNTFNIDFVSTSLKDFTEEFELKSPISLFISKLESSNKYYSLGFIHFRKKTESVKRRSPSDPIRDAIYVIMCLFV